MVVPGMRLRWCRQTIGSHYTASHFLIRRRRLLLLKRRTSLTRLVHAALNSLSCQGRLFFNAFRQ